jgi:hypothetical protein
MTTLTSSGLLERPGRRSPRGPQWVRATTWLLGAHLFLALWFWAIVVVAVTVALVVIDRVGTVTVSIMQFASQGATWFPFAIAIILTGGQIGVHVVSGMTRRSFLRASLVAASVSSLVYALAQSALMAAEGAVFERLGWPHATGEADRGLWEGGFGASLVEYGLVFLAAQVSGLLVGITYYRLGGWWGTLALPLTVGPVVLVQVAGPFVGGTWRGLGLEAPGALAVAVALLLITLGALAFARLARDVAIRPITS